MISYEKLRNAASELSILCIDSHEGFLKELVRIVFPFFANTQSANSLDSTIASLENSKFDIILMNPKLPNCLGVGAVEKIKNIQKDSNIIIISSHCNEYELFELIEHGITKIVARPFSSILLKESLYEVCRSISDTNMQEMYKIKLENANLELMDKTKKLELANRELSEKAVELAEMNIKLEKTVCTLQIKIEQINKMQPTTLQGIKDVEDEKDLYMIVSNEDIDELIDLEGKIDSAISMSAIGNEINREQIELLVTYLENYSRICGRYTSFDKLSQAIMNLSFSLKSNISTMETLFSRLIGYMDSMTVVLLSWRENLVSKKLPHTYYNLSMLSDIQMIISMIEGTQTEVTEEIELF